MIIFGFHAIEALLENNQKVFSIHVLEKEKSDRTRELKQLAQNKNVSLREYPFKDKARFEVEFRKLGGELDELESAQGVFAQIPDFQYLAIETLLAAAKAKEENPILIFLDSITDPQNIGSILRSSAFFGVAGLVIPENRSAPITSTALKISSGGFAHVPVARVTNLVQALELAKEAGFWAIGLSEHASTEFKKARFDAPVALVIGNEEKGIRDLTKKTCDLTVSLPVRGALQSLNAAVATAVTLALVRERQERLSQSS